MRRLLWVMAVCPLLFAATAAARDPYQEAVVQEPYVELRSGPGRGYPVFYVAERGETITLMKRRTQWYKIAVPRGEEGWVHGGELARTLGTEAAPFIVPEFSAEDYFSGRWEVGALYGDFGGANVMSAFGSRRLGENLSLELSFAQAFGRFSDSTLATVGIAHTFWPRRRASPYFSLGAGTIRTEPAGTLIAAADRTDRVANVGFGVRTYLARRFVLRAEYKSYVVFTSRDDNEEVREWKAGFSFYF